jgi:hypothetical protein
MPRKKPSSDIETVIVELADGMDGPARMRVALEALKLTVGRIAGKLELCPLCLTYAFADKIMDAEDAGRIAHGGMRKDGGVDDPFMPDCNGTGKGSVH